MIEVVRVNKLDSCYIRPLVLRGYGDVSVMPTKDNPIETYIACWEWGKYLGEEAMEQGVDVCVSSWTRMAPNTLPALSKAGANYMNSQLIRMEAAINGYAEGIALDASGYVSEGSGENLFVVRDGKILTPPLGASVLPGITRDTIIQLAQSLGIPVVESADPARDAVHRRRSVLQRHGGRGDADPFGGPDPDRQGQARPHHRTAAARVLCDRRRHEAGSLRLADASGATGWGRQVRTREPEFPREPTLWPPPPRLTHRIGSPQKSVVSCTRSAALRQSEFDRFSTVLSRIAFAKLARQSL